MNLEEKAKEPIDLLVSHKEAEEVRLLITFPEKSDSVYQG